ncbi:MAG: HNH endonuclease [Flavobacteriales bacterium]|nr:HNH endonuclease [Flavobacteriales bacterium]
MMQKENELVVGLDVGSNSVGWAVVEMDGEKLERIHGIGSRIIPMGDEKKEFEQGAKITKNAVRRQKRSMRRNHQRYKLRRSNLIQVLKLIGAWPEGLGERIGPDAPVQTSLQLYGLRALAVEDPVSLTELGRILYHMNQRRGYKDIGDLMDEQDGAAPTGESKDDGKSIEMVFIENVELEDEKGKKPKYLVTLADGRVGTSTIARIMEMKGSEQELEITTKETKKGTTHEFRLALKTDWRKGMESINQAIDESRLTPGQFFHQQLKADPLYRIRERIVLRDTFKAEFDAIWKRQLGEHAELGSDTLRDTVVRNLIPNNKAEQAKWLGKDLGSFIRDYVIYYQRPLKSQASSKGQCRFEPRKPVMPVSSPIYQLFRIWQQVNNIRLIDRYGKESELSAAERIAVVQHLLESKELKTDKLLDAIGRKKEELGNNLRANLPGHQTLDPLRARLKKSALWGKLLQEASTPKDIDKSTLFRIWHILYSIPMEEHRQMALKAIDGIPQEEVDALAKIRYDRKTGAVSARAASRITPLMTCGHTWKWENIAPRDQRRIEEVIAKVADGEAIDRLPNEVFARLRAYSTKEHFQGLPYWLAASVLYGDHRAAIAKPFDKPDQIKTLSRGFLRNPVVEQVVNESLMLMRDIWATYGRPTSVRVELARELRQNQAQRKRTFENNNQRDKDRKKVVEILGGEFSRPKPSKKDIERYELWVQQEHRCMYCGGAIQKGQLFDTRDTDVDHVIPRARFYDDSIQNRVIACRPCNADKGKQLAAAYMKSKGPGEWETYVDRVNKLKAGRTKKKYLLAEEVPESFINRQLQETRYIGTKLTELLQPICTVHSTLGIVTDALKNEWGLNEVYKEVLIPRFKRLEGILDRKLIEELHRTNGGNHVQYRIEGYDKRIDHRHHALDALTVALTRQGYIQRLSNVNQLNLTNEEKEALKRPTWYPLPHPDLRRVVRDQLERTIPSIKNRQRLLTKASNRTAYLDPSTGEVRKGDKGRKQTKGNLRAVRGPLHNEQPLGEVREQRKWPLKDVLKRLAEVMDKEGALHVLRPMDKSDPDYRIRFLAHEHERKLLHDHLAKYDGHIEKMKKALKKDPLVNAKNEHVEELTMLVPKYSTIVALASIASGQDMTKEKVLKRIEKIIDVKIKERVRKHFEAYASNPKTAFTDEALHAFNKGQSVPIHNVRCWKDKGGKDLLVGNAKGRTPMRRPHDPNRKLHVEKGENYALAVFVNEQTSERKFEVIPFFDAVERKLNGLDLVEARLGFQHFLLRKGDVVYVPRPDEDVRSINWTSTKVVGDRIMQMTKMTQRGENSGQFYFLPCPLSSPVTFDKKAQEFPTEFEDRDNPRTKISSVCIPVRVDRLGKVTPLFP